jgi:hypothetical protein
MDRRTTALTHLLRIVSAVVLPLDEVREAARALLRVVRLAVHVSEPRGRRTSGSNRSRPSPLAVTPVLNIGLSSCVRRSPMHRDKSSCIMLKSDLLVRIAP